jgi:hypothetical protein
MDEFESHAPPIKRLRKLFEYDHLPENLQKVSRIFARTAVEMLIAAEQDTPEVTEALRKLWEAKNLLVVAVARPEVTD